MQVSPRLYMIQSSFAFVLNYKYIQQAYELLLLYKELTKEDKFALVYHAENVRIMQETEERSFN